MEIKNKPLSDYVKASLNKEKSEAKEKEICENSKKQLVDMLEKRLKTTFIGAISSFENAFGYMWGHNKKNTDRNEHEKDMYNLWMQTRNEILNKSNVQSRAIIEDLRNYTVKFNMYKIVMRTKENE